MTLFTIAEIDKPHEAIQELQGSGKVQERGSNYHAALSARADFTLGLVGVFVDDIPSSKELVMEERVTLLQHFVDADEGNSETDAKESCDVC